MLLIDENIQVEREKRRGLTVLQEEAREAGEKPVCVTGQWGEVCFKARLGEGVHCTLGILSVWIRR